MFYSTSILAKKGPLAKIWLAAHWNKKLTKSAIFRTNINESCKEVLELSVPLALRMSGHLLFGIVRVYSRQVNYLFADCNDAMHKIRSAFKAGDVNLAEDAAEASGTAINIGGFGDFDDAPLLPDMFEDELEDGGATMPLPMEDEWVKMTSQPGNLMDDEFDEEPPSLADDDEEMLPLGEDDEDDGDLAPAPETPGIPRASVGSMPQMRGADTPADDDALAADDDDQYRDFVYDDNVNVFEDGAEAIPVADLPDDGDVAMARPSVLTDGGTPMLAAGANLVDDTPGSIRIRDDLTATPAADDGSNALEFDLDLDLSDDEGDAGANERKAAQRKSRRRGAPAQDKATQLPQSTIIRWNEKAVETLLPRVTTATRLRRQREASQAHWRRAIRFPERPGPYTSFSMPASSPDVTNLLQKLAEKPTLPPADDEDLDDDHTHEDQHSPVPEDSMMMEEPEGFEADDTMNAFESDDEGVPADARAADAHADDAHGETKGTDAHMHTSDDDVQDDVNDSPLMRVQDDVGAASQDGDQDPDRLKSMMQVLDRRLQGKPASAGVTYDAIAPPATTSRRLAAECFFKLLKLKSLDVVDVQQDEPFGDITISKTHAFDRALETGSFDRDADDDATAIAME